MHHRERERVETMAGSLLHSPAYIPQRVGGVLRLLDNIEDVEDLTPEQITAIRELLHLDDQRSVAKRMMDGDLDE